MTRREQEAIMNFRTNGRSYQEIADVLGLRKEAVRSYCRTHGIAPADYVNSHQDKLCPVCGRRIEKSNGRGRKRRFCSDECRCIWWKGHSRNLGHDISAIRVYRCMNCGKAFRGYEKAKRKYCSHECYIEHRFGTDVNSCEYLA